MITYNTDVPLWATYARNYPHACTAVRNGLLYVAPFGLILEREPRAHFESSEKATDVLVGAGWVQTGFGVNPTFEVRTIFPIESKQ